MGNINIGWIGAGFVGQSAHLERFINFDNCCIKGIADLRPELAKKVAKSYDIKDTYFHHTELLKDKSIEACIAIVNRRHTYEIAKDVLESGKHLFTEKPMASTYQQAKELVAIAEKKGLIYAAGFMRRYDSGVIKFKNLLLQLRKSSDLGKLLSVRIYVEAGSDYCGIQPRIITSEDRPRPKPINIAPQWIPKDKQYEYESFVNVCTHDVNLIRYLFEEICEISFVDYRPEGFSYALLNFGEFPGVFEWGLRVNDNDGWKEGVEIRFEKGQLSLELPPAFLRNVSSKIIVRHDSSTNLKESSFNETLSTYDWAFENSDKAFLSSIIDKKNPDHAGKNCLGDYDIIDNIWKHIIK